MTHSDPVMQQCITKAREDAVTALTLCIRHFPGSNHYQHAWLYIADMIADETYTVAEIGAAVEGLQRVLGESNSLDGRNT